MRIASVGELPIEGLTLIGASTKRGDKSKVGMFGSGLKYSIASLLKQEIPFHIFSGTTEFKITREEVSFSGSDFKQIYVNGEKTSFTDTMGNNDWTGAWPFTREIYSNALDAGGANISIVEQAEIEMIKGSTIFYIKVTPTVQQLVDEFEHYFITRSKHLYADSNSNYIHNASKGIRIYRKGILVYEGSKKSLFAYDLDDIEINESRIMKYSWTARDKIGRMIESCTDKFMISQFMSGIAGGNAGYYEHDCILDASDRKNGSRQFLEYIKEGKFFPTEFSTMLENEEMKGRLELPMKMLKRFIKYDPTCDIAGVNSSSGGVEFAVKVAHKGWNDRIAEAEDLLRRTAYGIRRTYPIKCVQFKDHLILGLYDKDCIYLAQKLSDYSSQQVATIIIEEQEHGISGHGDKTRSFQDHLFKLIYNAFGETVHLKQARQRTAEVEQELIDYKALPWYKKL